jgi:glycine betaine/choline ABC-type transport system substrate-binding protein
VGGNQFKKKKSKRQTQLYRIIKMALNTAQDLGVGNGNSSYNSGFNQRIQGVPYLEVFEHTRYGTDMDMDRLQGWDAAGEMIKNGTAFYAHWWSGDLGLECLNLKVLQDGDQWCCVGEKFTDLQSSDDYAFGESRDLATSNYIKQLQD